MLPRHSIVRDTHWARRADSIPWCLESWTAQRYLHITETNTSLHSEGGPKDMECRDTYGYVGGLTWDLGLVHVGFDLWNQSHKRVWRRLTQGTWIRSSPCDGCNAVFRFQERVWMMLVEECTGACVGQPDLYQIGLGRVNRSPDPLPPFLIARPNRALTLALEGASACTGWQEWKVS